MLINCPIERNERREQKHSTILQWLRDETWTTVEIISNLLEMTRQGSWKTLKQMEVAGFLRESKIKVVGKSFISLWGITPHGLAYAWSLNEIPEDRPVFEPSRIALSMIEHNLDLQRARLYKSRQNWTNWVRGERLGFKVKNRPDAIAQDNNGEIVAIEIERTVKTKKRYRQIMSSHLQQINKGTWNRVEYICLDDLMAKRLERIFNTIDYVLVNRQKVKINDRHYEKFTFINLLFKQ